MPKVSIVIPVCNVERYLDECLESAEAQALEDIEIICVNDGSTDSSADILRRHARRDDRIRVIDKPNAGYGHTINLGISLATGDYVGILESDDFAEPDMFQRLYEAAESERLDVVRANYWLYWSSPEPRNEFTEFCQPDYCDRVFSPREYIEPFFFPPALWSMLVRRELIAENGLRLLETPGASFQDTSFSFKIWSEAKRAMLLHDAFLHYRQDNEASSINNKSKAYYVCDEYAEVERFVQDDISDLSLMPIAQRRKYDAYVWNLGRIAPPLRTEFARRASREFSEALERGWLRDAPLTKSQQRSIRVLTRKPEVFVARFNEGASPAYPVLVSKLFSRVRGGC